MSMKISKLNLAARLPLNRPSAIQTGVCPSVEVQRPGSVGIYLQRHQQNAVARIGCKRLMTG